MLSIAAITTLVYFIIEAPSHGWANPFVISGLLGGAMLVATFLYWESKTDHPMLNLAYFKNPRFSAGAGAIALGFFSLFGMIFGMTQYLQFVQGFTPLEAGLRMAPIALGMAAGAGSSHRFVGRLGTNKVVAAGLVGLAVIFVTISFWQIDTNYWIIGGTFFFLAFSMGNVMAPSTDSVMGAVPEANAGVASAMNDVTRQVAGAFGVAVIGSVINTVYSGKMEPTAAGAFDASISDSIGATLKIASMQPPEIAVGLIAAAKSGFTESLGIAVLVAAAMAVVGAILVAKFMPARHLTVERDAETIKRGSQGEGPRMSHRPIEPHGSAATTTSFPQPPRHSRGRGNPEKNKARHLPPPSQSEGGRERSEQGDARNSPQYPNNTTPHPYPSFKILHILVQNPNSPRNQQPSPGPRAISLPLPGGD